MRGTFMGLPKTGGSKMTAVFHIAPTAGAYLLGVERRN